MSGVCRGEDLNMGDGAEPRPAKRYYHRDQLTGQKISGSQAEAMEEGELGYLAELSSDSFAIFTPDASQAVANFANSDLRLNAIEKSR